MASSFQIMEFNSHHLRKTVVKRCRQCRVNTSFKNFSTTQQIKRSKKTDFAIFRTKDLISSMWSKQWCKVHIVLSISYLRKDVIRSLNCNAKPAGDSFALDCRGLGTGSSHRWSYRIFSVRSPGSPKFRSHPGGGFYFGGGLCCFKRRSTTETDKTVRRWWLY